MEKEPKENKEIKEENLQEKGLLFLSGEIDRESVRRIQEDILRANIKARLPFLQMLISSPGGSVMDGFGLIDLMGWSKIPFATTGIGTVASMALLVLMAGQPGRRGVTPNSTLLSHRFSGMSLGNYSDMLARRKMEDLLHERVVAHYLKHTKLRDRTEVERSLLRDVDTWLTPEEALEYGMVDAIHRG